MKIAIGIASLALLSACQTSGDIARHNEFAERAFAACKMQASTLEKVPATYMGDCMRSKGFAENAATGKGPSGGPCNWFYCRPETTAGK